MDGETIVEFEQRLWTMYREADDKTKDSCIKHKPEKGLTTQNRVARQYSHASKLLQQLGHKHCLNQYKLLQFNIIVTYSYTRHSTGIAAEQAALERSYVAKR